MSNLSRLALRFLFWVTALTVVTALWGHDLTRLLLPLMRAELAWLDDTYEIQDLRLDTVGADSTVFLQVSQARTIVLGEQVFVPDPRGRAHASTLSAHVYLSAVLVLACALAMPLAPDSGASRWRWCWRAITRGLLTLLAMILVAAVDVPMVLWASIWSLHVDFAQPDLFSPLLVWSDFLESGGRLALGLSAGWVLARLI